MKQIKWFRNVFLLGATAFVLFFASCNQGNDNKKKDDKKNNQGEATQKFKVEFSLDKGQFTGNAELVAKDGTTKIKSGAEVEKGHTVTFEVTGLTAGYKVKWEGATEDSKDKKKATLKVEKKATVKATIEKEGTTPTPPPATGKDGKLVSVSVFKVQQKSITQNTAPKFEAVVELPSDNKELIRNLTDVVVKATDVDGANESALEVQEIQAENNGGEFKISEGKVIYFDDNVEKALTVTTKATDKIKAMTIIVKVTRKVVTPPPAEDPELKLTELKIHTKDVNRPATGDWTVTVPAATTKVEASNVEAKFTYGSVTTPEKLEVTVSPEALQATGETEITLTVAPVSGKYKGWSHKVKVTKEAATPTAKAQKLLTLTVFTKSAQIDTATGSFAASITLDEKKENIAQLTDIAGTSGDAPDGTANVGNLEIESIEVTVGSEKKVLDATHTDAIPLVTDGNKQTLVTVKTKATATKEAMTITLTITNHD